MDFSEGRKRVIIENVSPQINEGEFPARRVIGDHVAIQADIFADSHSRLSAELLYRFQGDAWQSTPMKELGNDRWEGQFYVHAIGTYEFKICAWIDRFGTWQQELRKRFEAGEVLDIEIEIGKLLLEEALKTNHPHQRSIQESQQHLHQINTALDERLQQLVNSLPSNRLYEEECPPLTILVEHPRAAFSAWYEFFPRSIGTFDDCLKMIPYIASMGFDIIYLPPIHPIGKQHRKGKNNSTVADNGPGSPWAIGSLEGGHDALHPDLGSLDSLKTFIAAAKEHGLDVALDLAFQCSPDHPYIKEHPQWFKWRPDGKIQHAENPPKKYQDIVPLNFETEDWKALWEELARVVLHWIEETGVWIFRVDNPHTKPFRFWEWLIGKVRKRYPQVIFLAEAFTRPKVMYFLAKCGFSQSYTYFTWRTTKDELTSYMHELVHSQVREFFRPNFWPNTPDILPENLQYENKAAFMIRLALAATLSSNYGIYGPPFELLVNEPIPGKEEYKDSEKYELKEWNIDAPHSLKDYMTQINRIRRDNHALQSTWNLQFVENSNEKILTYIKANEEGSNAVFVAINLDANEKQTGSFSLPEGFLKRETKQPWILWDLLNGQRVSWNPEQQEITIDPKKCPCQIFQIQLQKKREKDFDYFY